MYRCDVGTGRAAGISRWAAVGLAAGLLAILPACSIQFDTGANDNGSGNGNGSGAPVPEDGVALHIANQTDAAVDAEIFISTNGPGINPDDLFVEENRFTAGIGLAGAGIMEPQSSDEVNLACESGLVIGTQGGRFLDPDTGDELGTGPRRVLQEGLVFDCSAVIALVFRINADGDFAVTLALE